MPHSKQTNKRDLPSPSKGIAKKDVLSVNVEKKFITKLIEKLGLPNDEDEVTRRGCDTFFERFIENDKKEALPNCVWQQFAVTMCDIMSEVLFPVMGKALGAYIEEEKRRYLTIDEPTDEEEAKQDELIPIRELQLLLPKFRSVYVPLLMSCGEALDREVAKEESEGGI